MSITRYLQKNNDGSITIREIEEKAVTYHSDALDTAIENETDEQRKEILKNAKKFKESNKEKEIGLTKEEIDKKLLEQKEDLSGKKFVKE